MQLSPNPQVSSMHLEDGDTDETLVHETLHKHFVSTDCNVAFLESFVEYFGPIGHALAPTNSLAWLGKDQELGSAMATRKLVAEQAQVETAYHMLLIEFLC